MPTLNDFMNPLLTEGTNKGTEDEYRTKMKAVESLINQANTEKQNETIGAGEGAAFGKAIDTATAPTMGVGNALLGVKPTNYGNASGIINAYKGARETAYTNKLKDLLDTYKTSVAGENVAQDYGKNRIGALGKGADILSDIQKAKVASEDKGNKAEDKEWTDTAKSLDPTVTRAGEFGKLYNTNQSIKRAQALFDNAAADPDNLAKINTAELGEAYARVVGGGGGVTSEQRVRNLIPQSAVGNMNELKGWLTNNPQGLEQQEFVKIMRQGLERESKVAEDSMKQVKIQRLAMKAHLKDKDPTKWRILLKSAGLNPEGFNENMEYTDNPASNLNPTTKNMLNAGNKAKPKKVTQNGHTYILNESTGQYE